MNKIYKVLWSKTKGCYIVVSEIAKRNGKTARLHAERLGKSLVVGVALALFSTGGWIQPASAANIAADKMDRIWIANGGSATATGQDDIAIGTNAKASGDKVRKPGVVGGEALAIGAAAHALADQSTALGSNSLAYGVGSVAIGGDDTEQLLPVTGINYGFIRSDKPEDVGFKYRTVVSVGVGAVALGAQGQAIGNGSVAIGALSTAGDGGVTTTYTSADSDNGALEPMRTANPYATALGAYSHAQSAQSTAVGYKTQALGKSSTAVGNNAVAVHGRDIAIGTDVRAEGGNNGNNVEVPSVAIGYDVSVVADESVAIGRKNTVSGKDKNGNTLTGVSIIGHSNIVNASGVGILGNNNKITDNSMDDVFIVGNMITSVVRNSVFLGSGSAYITEGSQTKGNSKWYRSDTVNGKTVNFAGGAEAVGVVSVGSTAVTRRIQGVAPGFISATSTDAVNGSQLFAVASALSQTAGGAGGGNSVHYYSVGNPAASDGNYDNTGAKGTDSMAAGKNAVAWGNSSTAMGKGAVTGVQYPLDTENATNATAIGTEAKAYAKGSVALGSGAVAGEQWHPGSIGGNAVAIGSGAQATVERSIALGNSTKAQSIASVVIGDGANADANAGENNTVIGTAASITAGANNIAIGTQASSASVGGSIVLGNAASIGYNGADSIAIGSSSIIEGKGVAIGTHSFISNSSSTDGGSIAIGEYSRVEAAEGGIAIGKNAQSTNSSGNDGAPIAIGQEARARGVQSVAIGYQSVNTPNQEGQTAVGAKSTTYGTYSTALGFGSATEANQIGQTSIGYNARTNSDGGVALGYNSVAQRNSWDANSISVYIPQGASAAQKEAVNNTKATAGAVSIGGGTTADGKTILRQITNVAAGGAPTDAVNVAQLSAAMADTAASASQNFTVGADSGHAAAGVVITQDNTRFDVTSKDAAYLTTNVAADNKGIQIDLSDTAKNALGQVPGNTVKITNLTAAVDAGWEANVNGTKVKDVNPASKKLNFKNGTNISLSAAGDDITIATKDELAATKVTVGNTVMTTEGITVSGGDNDPVKLTKSGLDNGNNAITNVASGLRDAVGSDGQAATITTAQGSTLKNAANIGDVQKAVQGLTQTAGGGGFGLTAEDGGSVMANLGQTVSVVGDNTNIATKVEGGKIQVSLARDIKADSLTASKTVQDVNGINHVTEYTVDYDSAQFTKYNEATGLPEANSIMSVDTLGVSTLESDEALGESKFREAEIKSDRLTVRNIHAKNIAGSSAVSIDNNRTDVTEEGIIIKKIHAEMDGGVENGRTESTVKLTAQGLDNGMNRIVNVADGLDEHDAVNLSQLNKVASHYYSVRSQNQSAGSNYDNDGAKGLNSLAAGVSASTAALAENGVSVGASAAVAAANGTALGSAAQSRGEAAAAVGFSAEATGKNSVAVGAGSRSNATESVAIGSKIQAGDAGSIAIGRATKTDEAYGALSADSIAIGTDTRVMAAAVDGIAVGNQAKVEAARGIALGDQSSVAGENGMALGASASVAQGAEAATAVGYSAKANQEQATALGASSSAAKNASAAGFKAKADSENASAFGAEAQAGEGSSAFGRLANAAGEASVALGQRASAQEAGSVAIGEKANVSGLHGVAIGWGAVADTGNSVALGSNSVTAAVVPVTEYTIAGKIKHPAGSAPVGTVSVGSAAETRTITNVAAGRITHDSTDAVNGSQLMDVVEEIEANAADIAANTTAVTQNANDITTLKKGWKLTTRANGGSVSGNSVEPVTAEETVTVEAGKNIALRQAGSTLTVATSLTPEFTSVTAGTGGTQVVLSDAGVQVGDKTYITTGGLQAGNQKITNVANGQTAGDAVNFGQLQAVKAAAEKQTTVSGTNSNIIVTSTDNATGGKDYKVGLNTTVTLGNGTDPLRLDGNTGTVAGLTNRTWNVGGTTAVSGRAATEDQLKSVSDVVNTNRTTITANTGNIANLQTTVDKGLNFQGDQGAALKKELGETLKITGGVAAGGELSSEPNIGVVSEGGALNLKLAKNLQGLTKASFGTEADGITMISGAGVQIKANGELPAQIVELNANGLYNGGKKITGVGDGLIAQNSKEAVTGGQLWADEQNITRNTSDITTLKQGWNVNTGADGGNAEGSILTAVKAGDTVTVKAGKNLKLKQSVAAGKTDITLSLADKVTLGNAGKSIVVDGTEGLLTLHKADGTDGAVLDGTKGDLYLGGDSSHAQARLYGETGNAMFGDIRITNDQGANSHTITGLSNTTLDVAGFAASNRAATEEQLKAMKDTLSGSITASTTVLKGSTNIAVGGTLGNNADPYTVTLKPELEDLVSAKFKSTGPERTKVNSSGIWVTTADNINPLNDQAVDRSKLVGLTIEGINAGSKVVQNVQSDIANKNEDTFAQKLNRANQDNPGSAVNVSDLKNTYDVFSHSGLDFVGNDGAVNAVHRDLGTQLKIQGGINDGTVLSDAAKVSGRNIGVKKTAGNDGLDIVLLEDPEFNSVAAKEASFGTGTNKVTLGENSVKVGGNTYITSQGLNANGQKITNVAQGQAAGDAVNFSQLSAVSQEAGKHTTVEVAGGNLKLDTQAATATAGVKYTLSLQDTVTLGSGTHQVVLDGTAGTVTAGTVTAGGADGTVTGLSNQTWVVGVTNPVSGRAATEDQLKAVSDVVGNHTGAITTINHSLNGGMDFTGDDPAEKVNRKLGDTLAVKGGAAGALSDGNIGVVKEGDGLKVKLSKTLEGLTSVNAATLKAGENGTQVTLSDAGVQVGANTYITVDGLNANGQKIAGVKEGTNASDAVNYGQLKPVADTVVEHTITLGGHTATLAEHTTKIEQNTNNITTNSTAITTLQKGWKIEANATGTGKVTSHNEASVRAEDKVILYAGDNMVVSQTVSGSQHILTLATSATPKFTSVAVGSGAGAIALDGTSGLSIGGHAYISKEGIDAHMQKIQAVADGRVAGDSQDAVNGKQLFEAKTHYFSVNDPLTGPYSGNYNNDSATGTGALAAGAAAAAGGDYGTAVGTGSAAIDKDTVAVGHGASAQAERAVALGQGANSAFKDSVALGSGAVTAAVEPITQMQIHNATYDVAGTAIGTVSIGSAGKERTLTNLAAGRVNADSTDAVNGSQLYAVVGVLNKGFNFTANEGGTLNVKHGDTVRVQGGGSALSGTYNNTNVHTEIDKAAGVIDIQFSETPSFTKVTAGSGTTTRVTIGDEGVKVGANTYITRDGLNANGKTITNVADGAVAAGSQDAVNGGQLQRVIDGISASATGGFGLSDDADTAVKQDLGKQIQLKGENGLTVTADTANPAKKAMKIGLSATVTVGEKKTDATPGKDGTILVNGKDGSAVTLNGKDGSIGLQGKNGSSGLTLKGAAGPVGADGTDGNGGTSGMTRIVYHDGNVEHTVATLEDGMKYGGDLGIGNDPAKQVITKKLNGRVNITGGVMEEAKLSGEDNLGVISDGTDNLKIRLATELKGLTSVKTEDGTKTNVMTASGNTIKDGAKETKVAETGVVTTDGTDKTVVQADGITITYPKDNGTGTITPHTVSLTKAGLDNGGNKIINVADGAVAAGSQDAVNGGQLFEVQNALTNTINGGLRFSGDVQDAAAAANTFRRGLGDETKILGGVNDLTQLSSGNIGVVSNGADTLTVRLARKISDIDSITMEEGKTTVNPITGVPSVPARVTISGQGLRIVPKSVLNPDGTEKTDAASKRKIVTVNADGNNSINAGELFITNVKSSILPEAAGTGTFKEKLLQAVTEETLKNNAVNVTDLYLATEGLSKGNNREGAYGLKDEKGKEYKTVLGTAVQVTGDHNLNTELVTVKDGSGNPVKDINDNDIQQLEISLSHDLAVGGQNKDKTQGMDGSLTVQGGNGQSGVSFQAVGKDGETGSDGRINLTGKDGVAGFETISIRTERGQKTADGKTHKEDVMGDDLSRIVYDDGNITHTVSTLDDGMRYGGDLGEGSDAEKKVIKKNLNQQVNVVGGVTDMAKLADEDNLGVVSDGTDNLKIRLAKDLKGLTSIELADLTGHKMTLDGSGTVMEDRLGNMHILTVEGSLITDGVRMTTVGASGITITPSQGDASKNVSLTDSGLKNGANKILDVKSGLSGETGSDGNPATIATAQGSTLTNAANIGDVQSAVKGLANAGVSIGANAGGTNPVSHKLGDQLDIVGSVAKAGHTYSSENVTTEVSQDGAGKTTVTVKLDENATFKSVTADDGLGNKNEMKASGSVLQDTTGNKTEITAQGITITPKVLAAGKTAVTLDGAGLNNGGNRITNVAPGEADTDAATVGQLNAGIAAAKAAKTKVAVDGTNMTLATSPNLDGSTTYTVGLKDTVALGTDPAKQAKLDGTAGRLELGTGATAVTADGTTGMLQAGKVALDGGVGTVRGLTNTSWNPGSITSGQAATEDQLKAVDAKIVAGSSWVAQVEGTDLKIVKPGDNNLNFKAGNNMKVTGSGSDIIIAAAENVSFNQVTTGKTRMDDTGITISGSTADPAKNVSVTASGLDNGGNKITNVAPGEADTDAATVGQLQKLADGAGQAVTELGNRFNKLDSRVDKVGAGAAALAALHPVDFDADDKVDVAAGWGHYKGQNAMALGAFYRPDERTMFSIGGAFGNGENLINAGVTFKLDKRTGPTHAITSKSALVQEVAELKATNAEMQKQMQAMSEKMEKMEKLLAAK